MIDTLRRAQSSMVTGGLSPLDDSGWGELCRHYILQCAIACVLRSCISYRLATGVHNFTTLQGTEAISNICTLHGSPGEQRLFHLHPTWFPRGTEAVSSAPYTVSSCRVFSIILQTKNNTASIFNNMTLTNVYLERFGSPEHRCSEK